MPLGGSGRLVYNRAYQPRSNFWVLRYNEKVVPEEEYRRDNGYGRTVGPSKSAIVVWIVRNILYHTVFSGHARRVEARLYEKSSVKDSPSGYMMMKM